MNHILELLTHLLKLELPLSTVGNYIITHRPNYYTLEIMTKVPQDSVIIHFNYDGTEIHFIKMLTAGDITVTGAESLELEDGNVIKTDFTYVLLDICKRVYRKSFRAVGIDTTNKLNILLEFRGHVGPVNVDTINQLGQDLGLTTEEIRSLTDSDEIDFLMWYRNRDASPDGVRIDNAIYKLLGVDLPWESFSNTTRVADIQDSDGKTLTVIIDEYLENGTERGTVAYMKIPVAPGALLTDMALKEFGVGTWLRSDTGELYVVPERYTVRNRGPIEFN